MKPVYNYEVTKCSDAKLVSKKHQRGTGTPRPKWPKIKMLAIPVFGGRVGLCTSREEFLQALMYLSQSTPENDLAYAAGVTTGLRSPTAGRLYLVGVFDGTLRTLVHELAHVTFMLSDDIGIETDDGAREAFCYFLDSMFEQFQETIEDVGDKMFLAEMERKEKEQAEKDAKKAKKGVADLKAISKEVNP